MVVKVIVPPPWLEYDALAIVEEVPSLVNVALYGTGLPLLVAPPAGVALVTCGEPELARKR